MTRDGCTRSLGLLLLGLAAVAGRARALPEVTVWVGETPVTAEVAASPEERARGLAGRDRLAPDRGMLFIWPEPGPRRFWMKDTRIPLAVAFLDADGRILNIHRMSPPGAAPPSGLRRYPSRGPARFALEMNRGWFAAHGIGPGDRCRFRIPAGLAGPDPLAVGRPP